MVDIGIKSEDGIGVIKGAEELAANLVHSGLVELEIVPRLSVREHIPSQSIGAVSVESLERIHRVAQSLRHLVAILIED